ncbi:hypothetical protein CVT24_006402 [Panaeolus cyanescens]|uniref:Uncharacterized protein n=1 Tax=Panaeolus cyanescens TaxID=181874 RepID=A0A409WHS7_9AGAR|nr:hypothetical protein CVT24_006402 [Panaeolus cyanescens]
MVRSLQCCSEPLKEPEQIQSIQPLPSVQSASSLASAEAATPPSQAPSLIPADTTRRPSTEKNMRKEAEETAIERQKRLNVAKKVFFSLWDWNKDNTELIRTQVSGGEAEEAMDRNPVGCRFDPFSKTWEICEYFKDEIEDQADVRQQAVEDAEEEDAFNNYLDPPETMIAEHYDEQRVVSISALRVYHALVTPDDDEILDEKALQDMENVLEEDWKVSMVVMHRNPMASLADAEEAIRLPINLVQRLAQLSVVFIASTPHTMTHQYCPAVISASSGIWDIVHPMVIDRDWTPGTRTPFPASLDEVRAVFKRASPHLTVIIERINSGHFARCPPAMWHVFCWLFAFADLFPRHEGPALFLRKFWAHRPTNLTNPAIYYPRSSASFDYLYKPQPPHRIRHPIPCMRARSRPRAQYMAHQFSTRTDVPSTTVKLTAPSSSPSKRKASMELSTPSTSKQGSSLPALPYDSDVEEIPPFTVNKNKVPLYDSEVEEIPPFTMKKHKAVKYDSEIEEIPPFKFSTTKSRKSS